MMTGNSGMPVYLACGATDLRKSIDGLAWIVQGSFELDPLSGGLFAFCNRDRDKIKILVWEGNGFWLHYKRLEKGRFHWPGANAEGTMALHEREFRWLLDGLDYKNTKAHRSLQGIRIG